MRVSSEDTAVLLWAIGLLLVIAVRYSGKSCGLWNAWCKFAFFRLLWPSRRQHNWKQVRPNFLQNAKDLNVCTKWRKCNVHTPFTSRLWHSSYCIQFLYSRHNDQGILKFWVAHIYIRMCMYTYIYIYIYIYIYNTHYYSIMLNIFIVSLFV